MTTGEELMKAWRTVQAEATLAGFTANIVDDDSGQTMLVVSRWAMCRNFTVVDEARTWLQRVVGKAAKR